MKKEAEKHGCRIGIGMKWIALRSGNGNNSLKVTVYGDGKAVNRSAIGTQVRIRVGDKTLTRQVEAGTGEGTQNDLTLHFGLGPHNAPVSLEVLWPYGTRQTVGPVEINRVIPVRKTEK